MKKFALNLIAGAGFGGLLMVTGCVSTLDDTTTAGNPIGRDTVEARYERPRSQVWQAAKDVLAFNGKIESEDVIKFVVKGKVDNDQVWIRVDQEENPNMTHVYVQVRPKNLVLAGELDKQIAIRLATGKINPKPATE